MRTRLEVSGHRIVAANDRTNGLAVALQMRPEAAVIDVDLPGIDGYRVAQNFRSLEIGHSVLSVARTGGGPSGDPRARSTRVSPRATRGRRHATQRDDPN